MVNFGRRMLVEIGRLLTGGVPEYEDFLEERRKLMALKIRAWFEAL